MTDTRTDTATHAATAPTLRIREPGDLIEAIPYLLGFHPRDSLVVVGLDGARVVVTARIDLADATADEPGTLEHTVGTVARGGASFIVAVVYDRGPSDPGELPWGELVYRIGVAGEQAGSELADAFLVAGERWWSYACADESCCPPEGRPLPGDGSASAATATFAGLVALPDRADLEGLLTPVDAATRAALLPALAECENAAVQAVLDGRARRQERSVKRAIFAAARDSDGALFPGPSGAVSDRDLCRFAVALSDTAIRDAVWLAVDQGRLDGRSLWREMARRLPGPYDAPALFLFGWAHWRDGDGAMAGIAAQRALASDPGYRAADLLIGALAHGLNPHTTPKLRMPRPG